MTTELEVKPWSSPAPATEVPEEPEPRKILSRYRCHVVVQKADDGGYLGIVPDLPSAYTQGESIEDTVTRLREAIAGVIRVYLEESHDIPWLEEEDYAARSGDIHKWIVVDV